MMIYDMIDIQEDMIRSDILKKLTKNISFSFKLNMSYIFKTTHISRINGNYKFPL